jgi:hypothetical protein
MTPPRHPRQQSRSQQTNTGEPPYAHRQGRGRRHAAPLVRRLPAASTAAAATSHRTRKHSVGTYNIHIRRRVRGPADERAWLSELRQTRPVRIDGPLPFHGYVVWLTREQGGRDSGPPPTPAEQDYAATGFVPPADADSGLASVVLRVRDRTAWQSTADARWLVVDNVPPHRVSEGDVIVITEGRRVVACFHVDSAANGAGSMAT